MSTEHDALRDLLAAAALGAASPAETDRVERHAATCAVCAEELDLLRSSADVLALAVPQVEPPPELRGRLMDAVRAEPAPELDEPPVPARPQPERRFGLRAFLGRLLPARPWPAIAGGLAALALALVTWNVVLQTRSDDGAAGALTAISVRGTAAGEEIRGQALVIPSQGTAVLHLNHLPPLPEGRVYQLWAVHEDGTPSWAGTMVPSLPGEAVVATADLAGVEALAITHEASSNRAAPTVDPWVVVSLPQQG